MTRNPSGMPRDTQQSRQASKGRQKQQKQQRRKHGLLYQPVRPLFSTQHTSSMVSRSSVMSASLKNSALSDNRKLSIAIVRSRFTCMQGQNFLDVIIATNIHHFAERITRAHARVDVYDAEPVPYNEKKLSDEEKTQKRKPGSA